MTLGKLAWSFCLTLFRSQNPMFVHFNGPFCRFKLGPEECGEDRV